MRLEVAGGPRIVVVAAHLEGDARSQIEALLEAWDGRASGVIAGDTNIQVSDEANVALFTDAGLVDAADATGDPCTWMSPASGSGRRRPRVPIHLSVAVPGDR